MLEIALLANALTVEMKKQLRIKHDDFTRNFAVK